MEELFTFGEALDALRRGSRVQRLNWNGKGLYVAMQTVDEHSKMGHPYLYIKSVDDTFVPWTPSQTDVLADDWRIL